MAFAQDLQLITKYGLRVDSSKSNIVRTPGNAIPGSDVKSISKNGLTFYFWRIINKSVKGGFEYLCRIDFVSKTTTTIKSERVQADKITSWLKLNVELKAPGRK